MVQVRDHGLSQLEELTAAAVGLREDLSAAQTRTGQLGDQLTTALRSCRACGRTEGADRITGERTRGASAAISAADLAEQHGERAAGRIEQLVTELTLGRQQVERWQAQAVEYCAELAAARSELTAAMVALDSGTHPRHSTSR